MEATANWTQHKNSEARPPNPMLLSQSPAATNLLLLPLLGTDMPARRRRTGGGVASPQWAAGGVAAASRGGGDGRELAVGTRAGHACGVRARGRAARAGGDGAALPRLGHPRAHRLRLLPRELEPPQGTCTPGRARFCRLPPASTLSLPVLAIQMEVDFLMGLFERVIHDSVAQFLRYTCHSTAN